MCGSRRLSPTLTDEACSASGDTLTLFPSSESLVPRLNPTQNPIDLIDDLVIKEQTFQSY